MPIRSGLDACRCIDRLSCFSELGWLFAHCRASRTVARARGERTLKYCGFCGVHSCVRSVVCGSVAWWIILWNVMGASRGMNNIMWRYGLAGDRPVAMSGRFRDEALRCVATRRLPSRTGVVSGSANLEKTGCILVKSQNKWLVFQCTVNWPRARLKTALIASGARVSSRI